MYSDFTEDYISDKLFWEQYDKIRENLTEGKSAVAEKCTIILGGQPGAGKSSFYEMRDELADYIAINGDEFRRFHPNYRNIIKTDPEHYTERTQSFANKVVENLISDLGSKGYSLIIEGTLRNPNVPINTCEYLKGKGYSPELVVVACDAEKAWKSTISRAEIQKSRGIVPRLVPIDIYNYTVHQIPDSLDKIEKKGCFASITIINREGDILFDSRQDTRASEILRQELDLDNWDNKLSRYEEDFIKEKISLLQSSLSRGGMETNEDLKTNRGIEDDLGL